MLLHLDKNILDAPGRGRGHRLRQGPLLRGAGCAGERAVPGRIGRVRTRVEQVAEAFLHHLAVERGSAENTLRSYTADLRRYAEHLAGAGIDDLGAVREADVSGFVAALRSGPTG